MPQYTFKLVTQFSAFDDVEARKISRLLAASVGEYSTLLPLDVRVMKHGTSENIMKRPNTVTDEKEEQK